jgi:hypothetical protein
MPTYCSPAWASGATVTGSVSITRVSVLFMVSSFTENIGRARAHCTGMLNWHRGFSSQMH